MITLSRYLARSVALTSVAGILVFVFILITGNALRDILGLLADGQLPAGLFFRLVGLLIPYAVAFAMPLGMLIAILLTMGRLSANHELTAIKAAGISLYAVTAPILLVALAGTALSIYINVVHAPQARSSYKTLLADVVRTDPLRFIVPRTFIHQFPGYILYVGEKEGQQLGQFWLWELDKQQRAVRLLRAETGSLAYAAEEDALILSLSRGFTELRDPEDPDNLREVRPTLTFSDARIRLPLGNLTGRTSYAQRLDYLPVDALLQLRRDALADPATADLERASEALYQISRRLAMGFSVFSLAIFAMPLGMRVGRTETHANFAIALVIAMAYYLALILVGWTAQYPHLRPELLVWLPNMLVQAVGFWMLHRAARY
jgi:lipopolysaccharide export system permease protein